MNAYVRWRTSLLIALLAGPLFIGCAGGPSSEVEEAILLEGENSVNEFNENATNQDEVAFAEDELASDFDFEENPSEDDALLSDLDENFENEAEENPFEEEAQEATMSEVVFEQEADPVPEQAYTAPIESLYEESDSLLSRGEAGTPAAVGLPEIGSKMPYIIQKGDTLSKVAQKVYGSSSKWRDIADLSGLENPDVVFPGEVIYYQLSEESLAYAQAQLRAEEAVQFAVVVEPGDSLSKLAQDHYGVRQAWAGIWQANSQIQWPDQVEVGTTLYLNKTVTPENSPWKIQGAYKNYKVS